LKISQEHKLEKLEEMRMNNLNASLAIKTKIFKKLDKQELDRLDLDVKLKKKIDEYSTRYQTELERKKRNLEQKKMTQSLENFEMKFKEELEIKEKKHKEKEEKPIKKYETWYIKHFNEEKKKKEQKQDHKKQRDQKMIENLEKIENDRKVIADEILNKLKASEIKRNTFQEKKRRKIK